MWLIGFIIGVFMGMFMMSAVNVSRNADIEKELKSLISMNKKWRDKYIKQQNENKTMKKAIKEVLEYLDVSTMSWIDKDEIAIRLKGEKKNDK